MISTILWGAVGGICGALCILALRRWRLTRRASMTPLSVWVWPTRGQPPAAQRAEGYVLAAAMFVIMDRHDRTRFAAQWDSGLGPEFPTL